MYYNILLFLLPTTKLRFTGRLDPGKVFPRQMLTVIFCSTLIESQSPNSERNTLPCAVKSSFKTGLQTLSPEISHIDSHISFSFQRSLPETHTKRQATHHACLPRLLGDRYRGIGIVNGEKKFFSSGPTRAAKAELTINVPVVYMRRDEMILMWATSISRAIGKGGP